MRRHATSLLILVYMTGRRDQSSLLVADLFTVLLLYSRRKHGTMSSKLSNIVHQTEKLPLNIHFLSPPQREKGQSVIPADIGEWRVRVNNSIRYWPLLVKHLQRIPHTDKGPYSSRKLSLVLLTDVTPEITELLLFFDHDEKLLHNLLQTSILRYPMQDSDIQYRTNGMC